jgi:hypothetical protein
MTPETEVIACPECKHLLRVPLDWLGTQVQCPECKAMFRAPVRENGKLTEPELISRPWSNAAPTRRKFDMMLLLPAFGLMFCGFASALVNGMILYTFATTPGGAHAWAKDVMVPGLRQAGFGKEAVPNDQAKRDEQEAAQLARMYQWIVPLANVVGVVVFLGGLSIVFRWSHRLSKIACVLAALNFPHLCCLPGALFGLWGLLMLNSDEAREHFQK